MRQTAGTRKSPGEKIVKDIKRATRKHYSSEEKIRIVLDGLRGEDSIAELCRREGISQGIYYKWSKDFMEAGKLSFNNYSDLPQSCIVCIGVSTKCTTLMVCYRLLASCCTSDDGYDGAKASGALVQVFRSAFDNATLKQERSQ